MYKSLLKIDNNNGYGKRDVSDIEKNLSTYGPKTTKRLRTDVINVARDEFEDVVSRKLDKFDELISKFDV